ncbi:hypothetical protein LPJ63_004421 [Coemansia sp. RSA 2711]|nr:hypothetical protein LPJ63_004421 [Coemansia sp. RSA 2711]
MSSLKTHTSSSKHTAFYSAQSHLGDSSTASYHTADDATTDMPQQRFGGWAPQHKQQVEEDENLVHSMARQYVLDAEAMGPADRARRDTGGSRGLGGDIVTTTSDDMMPVPQLPLMGGDRDSEKLSSHRSSGRALSERLRDEEVEDDANEARHFVSTRTRYPAPRYRVAADGRIPAGAVLFACGFVLLPLWWIGAVFPRSAHDEVVRTWRKYNALMTLLSLPLLGLFLALGGWQATHD